MGMISITVTLDASNNLSIDPPDPVTIQDGDWVSWKFLGLTGDQFGFISFNQRFGPFHSLRSFFVSAIAAKGNVGPAADNTYPYRAIVFDQNADGASSTQVVAIAESSIVNAGTRVDTAPDVIVHYEAGTQQMTVDPFSLTLNLGDTATWHFLGLPANCFGTFYFDLPEGVSPHLFNPATGPFKAVYASGGSGLVSVQASGTGFGLGLTGIARFGYRIEIHDPTGATLAVKDPAIDNLGPPGPLG
jgi:hypothetical protein